MKVAEALHYLDNYGGQAAVPARRAPVQGA